MTSDSTRAREGATALTIRERWDANFAAWEAAKVKFDLIDAAHTTAHEEAGGKASAVLTKLDEAHDRNRDDEAKKRHAVIMTPAPDHAAVMTKMHFLFGQEYAEQGAEDEYVSAWHRSTTDLLIADMARLQSEIASAWLDHWTKHGGSVLIDDEGAAQYSWPADSNVPTRESGLGEEADRQDACWNDGHWHGKMQGLYAGLSAGLSPIVKAHMRANGVRVIYRQQEAGR